MTQLGNLIEELDDKYKGLDSLSQSDVCEIITTAYDRGTKDMAEICGLLSWGDMSTKEKSDFLYNLTHQKKLWKSIIKQKR